jgi:hypothetical protein
MLISGKSYLITTDEFFYAPDGFAYKSVYGKAFVNKFEDYFSFTARNHANWFVSFGGVNTEEDCRYLSIAGCRINYWIPMDEPPKIMFTNMTMMLGADNIPFPFYYPNIYIVKSE